MASKTLKGLIKDGYATVDYIEADDSVTITRKSYDTQTGEEVSSQIETLTRDRVKYYLAMRESQVEDWKEVFKVFPST